MICLTTQELSLATGAEVLVSAAFAIEGEVVIDSRLVETGSVFVAFRGERLDGNAYLTRAIGAGAGAVVASADVPADVLVAARASGCAVLRAQDDDCEEFLLRLAGEWRVRHPAWTVVGVTGSVGKTTTKDMLRAGIATSARVHATSGNLNNLIGLPLTVLSAPEDTEVLVCELGMNHPHEIDRLAAACRPTLAVITNVGTSHIGLLGSRENIARAKAEIVSGMEAHEGLVPCLVLTSANDYASLIEGEFARPAGVRVLYAGSRETDDVRSEDMDVDEAGLPSFVVRMTDGWSRRVRLHVPGRQVVGDFLLAMAVIALLGLDRDAAADAIAAMPAASMRLSVATSPAGVRVIDDSYNASPNSMAAALDVLSEMRCDGRRVAVLGEMGELGVQEDYLHALVGAYAAAKPLDMLVCVGGTLAATMAESARTMGFSDDRIVTFPTVEDATATMRPVLGEGDLVLVKASRAAGLDAFAKGVLA